ncbi:hypothetical protein AB1K42_16270 [Roseibium algicola]|jgi:hypothetical protein|uniref:hypothetical protein n=1 Tax=Roseibium algicola TaxID=2857014 RepID=UPI003459CD46
MKLDLINDGIVLLNEEVASSDESATLITVGVARSGTSMIGAVLRQFNVFLGDKADDAVFEDLNLSKALEEGDTKRLDQIIFDYNKRHKLWGFKRPEAFDLLPRNLNRFRNPRMIVMLRDPASIAKRNEVSMHADFLEQMRRAAERTLDLVRFVETIKVPTLVISYEKALLNPNRLVEKLAEFCGIQLDEHTKAATLAAIENGPELYLQNSRVWYEGQFFGVFDGLALGWARRLPGNFVCNVEIWAGDEILGTGASNLWREELPENVRDRAFSIPLKKRLDILQIEARISETKIKL